MHYLDHLLECPIGPFIESSAVTTGFLTGLTCRPHCLNFSALPAIHV